MRSQNPMFLLVGGLVVVVPLAERGEDDSMGAEVRPQSCVILMSLSGRFLEHHYFLWIDLLVAADRGTLEGETRTTARYTMRQQYVKIHPPQKWMTWTFLRTCNPTHGEQCNPVKHQPAAQDDWWGNVLWMRVIFVSASLLHGSTCPLGGGKDCPFFHCIWTMCFTEGSHKKKYFLPAKSSVSRWCGQKNRPIPNDSGTRTITPTV